MAETVGLVNLGCAKNQVDAEIMLATLKKAGYEPVPDAAAADVAIVNTCGFIDAAKRESIGEILELARRKAEGKVRAIVVTGCLAERYREQILRELPEVDAVAGIGADSDIAAIVGKALAGGKLQSFPEKTELPLCGERRLLTPKWTAYLKIAEGCDNRCAYCAIPAIRGRYRSRTMENILEEAETLAASGVKELVLVAQDTTRYGWDLYKQLMLPELLRKLCRIEGFRWIRVLYGYPDSVTDELLETMANEEKIVKYFDLPLQHCSGRVLRSMNRPGDRASLTALIRRMREKIPGVVLRSTLIVGLPGETEEDFGELCGFVKEMRFERLGCFAYSQEEGTAAAKMPDQVDADVALRRQELITEIQMDIMQEQGEAMVGKTLPVLVEGYDRSARCWTGRSQAEAPDVDGKIYFSVNTKKRPTAGTFVTVAVTACEDGELHGETADES